MGGLVYETELLDVATLAQLHEHAAERFTAFNPFAPGAPNYGEFKLKGEFPDLSRYDGVTFATVYLWAAIPKKKASVETALEILTSSEPNLTEVADVSVICTLEDPESSQTKSNGDVVTFRLMKRMGSFRYRVGGSRAKKDIAYRASLFEALIERLDLPAEIRRDGSSFVVVTRPLGLREEEEREPRRLAVMLDDEDTDLQRVVDLTQTYFRQFPPKRVFGWNWSVSSPDDPGDPDRGRKAYAAVARAGFPAGSVEVNFKYQLRELTGVEALRALARGRSSFSTRFGAVRCDDGQVRELTDETNAEGHRLSVEMRSPDYVKELEQKLGVEFRNTGT